MTDIAKVLAERGTRYGEFKEHALIAQNLKYEMKQAPGWQRLDADQREALEMIQHKIARILNGDPNYADSWTDIAGYAKLVADRLDAPIAVTESQSDGGWIAWGGGECPVSRGTFVDVQYRDGAEEFGLPALTVIALTRDATQVFWRADGVNEDIIAYRIAKTAPAVA